MYLIVESYFSEILLIVAAATQQLVATAFHEMALPIHNSTCPAGNLSNCLSLLDTASFRGIDEAGGGKIVLVSYDV